MLRIIRTGMLIIAGNALGFLTGSGIVIPFSVDLSNFCRRFREERNTRNKIYIGYNVLLVNEVHNVIPGNSPFEIPTSIWYKIIFRTQKRRNCKLCRIIRRETGFIVVVHRFMQREKLFNSDKVEHWILIVSRYWWENSTTFGYVGSRKKRVAVVENDFKRMNSQSSKLLLLYDFNRFIPAIYGQPILFWSKLHRFPYMGGVSFFDDSVQVFTLFVFQFYVQSNFSRQPVALSGDWLCSS